MVHSSTIRQSSDKGAKLDFGRYLRFGRPVRTTSSRVRLIRVESGSSTALSACPYATGQNTRPETSAPGPSLIRKRASTSIPRIASIPAVSPLRPQPGSIAGPDVLSADQMNSYLLGRSVSKCKQPEVFQFTSKKITRDPVVTRVRSTRRVVPGKDFDGPDRLAMTESLPQTVICSPPLIRTIPYSMDAKPVRRQIRRAFIVTDEKQEEKVTKRRRCAEICTTCCPCCPPYCCLICTLLLALLLLAGLITLLVLLLTNHSATASSTGSTLNTGTAIPANTTTITTVSTATTSTSTQTTSTTSTATSTTTSTTTSSQTTISSTTSTSTSSSSTSSTSTTTSTSSTTSTTTSTSTTVSTTTSTSTSTSTSRTTSSTTSTSTSTTTVTTRLITSNTCTAAWSGVDILYHCDNCSNINPYTRFNYTYTAIANQTRISFSFREDSGFFALDGISVQSILAPGVELIANNGFETGSVSSWTYCNPGGASSPGQVYANSANLAYLSTTYLSQSGNYFYGDGAVGSCDYLYQKFATHIGETYTISYWLFNMGSGSQSSADIMLST